jgi:hypothetical protein
VSNSFKIFINFKERVSSTFEIAVCVCMDVWVCICVYECVCVCVCVCVCACPWVSLWKPEKPTLDFFPLFSLWDWVSQWIWDLPMWLDWLVSGPLQESLCPLSATVTGCDWLLCGWVWVLMIIAQTPYRLKTLASSIIYNFVLTKRNRKQIW